MSNSSHFTACGAVGGTTLALALALALAGCFSQIGPSREPASLPPPDAVMPDPNRPGPPPLPFQPLPSAAYVTKVKNLLTGLPVMDDELKAVTADPAALRGLVDGWIETPAFRAKMLQFFKQAFQQTQTDIRDYEDQLGHSTNPWNPDDKTSFLRSAEESFARTVLQLMDEGKPFHATATTERFMLNPPLMSFLAFMDAAPHNDDGKPVLAGRWLVAKYGARFRFELVTIPTPPIPWEVSLSPTLPDGMENPDFLRFYVEKPTINQRCPVPVTNAGGKYGAMEYIQTNIFGGRPACGATGRHWTADDYGPNAWRMVTIRKPKPGEERTVFFDIAKLRSPATTELVLNTPRVGFMTTPAFLANWPTNPSNNYRVTANQAVIVGLGKSFDDRGTTVQLNDQSNDNLHLHAPCRGCHNTLDPMRDFFKQSYSITYSEQLTPNQPPTATFNVGDAPAVQGNGIRDFAKAMATNPLYATAWTQKLCQFANSSSCEETDPEFVRVADVFRKSGFQFKSLVAELFSSPLVTFAKETQSAKANGVVMSITRRETFCAAIESRYKITDVCSERGENQLELGLRNLLRNLAGSIPGAGYARGDDAPLLPHDPNLFFTSATENFCARLSLMLVDTPQSRYSSMQQDPAMADFVTTLMGVPPSDSRHAALLGVLKEHHQEATRDTPASASSRSDILRSTFTVACSSALATSIGL